MRLHEVLVAFGAAVVFPIMTSAAERAPNIIYILADDMGYGDCSCYNPASKIPTPNIDRLATQGIRLTNEHAPSSVCSPSRYAILTGRYAWRSPLQMGVLGSVSEPIIISGRMTVASLLRQHGYTTAAIGKWHLGMDWPTIDGQRPWIAAQGGAPGPLSNLDFTKPIRNGPTERGFDYYFGTNIPNYPPYCFIENDRTVGIPSASASDQIDQIYRGSRPGPMTPGWRLENITPELAHRATAYISEMSKGTKPFFLYLALISPHGPIVPTKEFHGRSGAGDYGDYVVETDWVVGQVMAALEKAGLAENTLLVFTSDNGPEVTCGEVPVGAYDRLAHYGHASVGEWRGVKHDTWEGGHRMPFIARWPGRIPTGSTSDELVSHSDLFATAAAIVGATVPENAAEDSVNILPILLGQSQTPEIRPTLVLNSGWNQFALRQGDWVFIDAPSGDSNAVIPIGPKDRTGHFGEPEWFKQERGYASVPPGRALFNLRQDPGEHHNLLATEPGRAKTMRDLLQTYIRTGRSTPGAPQANDVPIQPFRYSPPFLLQDDSQP